MRTFTKTSFNSETLIDTEWAYLAGLIDGEGSLQVRPHRVKGRPLRYYPRVVIKMHAGAWERIIEKLGIGNLYSHQGKHLVQSAWYLYRFKDIEPFLETLMQYLLVKRKHAKILLDWIRTGDNTKPPSNLRHLSRSRDLMKQRKQQ